MKPSPSLTSACRRCRYYEPQGRRGGQCHQLNVAVQGDWTACALAIPPFTPAWENLEDIMVWQQKTFVAMQESALAEALQAELYPDATVAAPCSHSSDRPAMEANLIGTASHPATQTPPGVTRQTMGIKALWM